MRRIGALTLLAIAATSCVEPATARPGRNERVHHAQQEQVPTVGPRHAPVTIEFFLNLNDGRKVSNLRAPLAELAARHPRRLRILFYVARRNPLNYAALEAHEQGKFFAFVDAAFSQDRYPKASRLEQYAEAAGLDLGQLRAALDDGRHQRAVERAEALLSRRTSGSERLLFNGVPEKPRTVEQFEEAYDRAYARAQLVTDHEGLSAEQLFPRLVRDLQVARSAPRNLRGLTDGEAPTATRSPPRLLETDLVTATGRELGPRDARIVIRLFCTPATKRCKRMFGQLQRLQNDYEGMIRIRIEPLFDADRQPEAPLAQEALLCAGDQDRFWELADQLFSDRRKNSLQLDRLHQRASQLLPDPTAFADCLQTRRYQAATATDLESAQAAGIHDTPTFIVNRRVHVGILSPGELRDIIEEELRPGLLERADELRAGVLSRIANSAK